MSNKYLEKIASWVDEDGGLDKEASNRLTKEVLKSFKSGRMAKGSPIHNSISMAGNKVDIQKGNIKRRIMGERGVDLDTGFSVSEADARVGNHLSTTHVGRSAIGRGGDVHNTLDNSSRYKKKAVGRATGAELPSVRDDAKNILKTKGDGGRTFPAAKDNSRSLMSNWMIPVKPNLPK